MNDEKEKSGKVEFKPHARMPWVDDLTIERMTDCEFEKVDPNVGNCISPATHIVRELSVNVCAGHAAGVRAIHAEQMNERLKDEEKREEKAEPVGNQSESSPAQGLDLSGIQGQASTSSAS